MFTLPGARLFVDVSDLHVHRLCALKVVVLLPHHTTSVYLNIHQHRHHYDRTCSPPRQSMELRKERSHRATLAPS